MIKLSLSVLFVAGLTAGVGNATPFLFTSSGAGIVGLIAGANVTELDQSNGNITAPPGHLGDMVIGFVNLSVAFKPTGPDIDTGVVDYSNTSLTNSQNCNGDGGGGPTTCFVNAQSSLSNTTITGGTASNPSAVAAAANEMQAVSTAWAAVTGTAIASNATSLNTTGCSTSNVTVSPSGGSSFGESGCVYNINNVNALATNSTFQITGDGSKLIILNYTAASALNWQANLTLTGGIMADQVLLNFTDGSTTTLNNILVTSGHPTINADLAVTSGTVQLNSATIDGRIYLNGSGTSQINSGFNENLPANVLPTPEPGSWLMLSGSLIGLGVVFRKRLAKRG
jgi:hypothetical protein